MIFNLLETNFFWHQCFWFSIFTLTIGNYDYSLFMIEISTPIKRSNLKWDILAIKAFYNRIKYGPKECHNGL